MPLVANARDIVLVQILVLVQDSMAPTFRMCIEMVEGEDCFYSRLSHVCMQFPYTTVIFQNVSCKLEACRKDTRIR